MKEMEAIKEVHDMGNKIFINILQDLKSLKSKEVNNFDLEVLEKNYLEENIVHGLGKIMEISTKNNFKIYEHFKGQLQEFQQELRKEVWLSLITRY